MRNKSLNSNYANSSANLTVSNRSSNLSSASASYIKYANVVILNLNVTVGSSDIAVGGDLTFTVSGINIYSNSSGCGYSGSACLIANIAKVNNSSFNATIRVLGSAFKANYSSIIRVPVLVS